LKIRGAWGVLPSFQTSRNGVIYNRQITHRCRPSRAAGWRRRTEPRPAACRVCSLLPSVLNVPDACVASCPGGHLKWQLQERVELQGQQGCLARASPGGSLLHRKERQDLGGGKRGMRGEELLPQGPSKQCTACQQPSADGLMVRGSIFTR
jgi:hypothetical protein